MKLTLLKFCQSSCNWVLVLDGFGFDESHLAHDTCSLQLSMVATLQKKAWNEGVSWAIKQNTIWINLAQRDSDERMNTMER